MVVPAGSGHLARQAVTGGIKSRLGGEGGLAGRLGGEGGVMARLGEQGGGREQDMDWDPEADRSLQFRNRVLQAKRFVGTSVHHNSIKKKFKCSKISSNKTL